MTNYRDASTGQYTTAADAAARPAETVAESVPTRHEAPDVAELRRTLGLSIRNVLRSELGHEQPFDPHSWRCADKVRYPGPCGCADEVADMAVAAVAPGLLDAATDTDALRAELAHMTEARDNARAEVERLTAMVERVRDWLDHRGVDVSDRDGAYMDGYRAAQRHAVQDAAELRAALDGGDQS